MADRQFAPFRCPGRVGQPCHNEEFFTIVRLSATEQDAITVYRCTFCRLLIQWDAEEEAWETFDE